MAAMVDTAPGDHAQRLNREPMTVVDFPDQLRNDIFYCQRALKEHIKIHQFCAVQYAIKPSKRYSKIIFQIENEIRNIALDQQKVIDSMKKHLRSIHTNKLLNPNATEDFDNKIIHSYLDMHRPSIGGLALQASGFIQSRATEKELIRNHDLLSDLQKFMRPTTVIERVPLSPMKGRGGAMVSESRRKFLAALKAVKPQDVRNDSESDGEDVQFLSQSYAIMNPSGEIKLEEEETRKKVPGRPRKSKLKLLNSGSAPSTRANSPEVVTMPYVELPEEPEETNDYDQPGFLVRLGLHTLEMAKYLKNKRPERRRRTMQSTERKDFHYGQIDLLRMSALKNKKPVQYLSPKTFRKRRNYDRSASSSPPIEVVVIDADECTCKDNKDPSSSPCPKCVRKST